MVSSSCSHRADPPSGGLSSFLAKKSGQSAYWPLVHPLIHPMGTDGTGDGVDQLPTHRPSDFSEGHVVEVLHHAATLRSTTRFSTSSEFREGLRSHCADVGAGQEPDCQENQCHSRSVVGWSRPPRCHG